MATIPLLVLRRSTVLVDRRGTVRLVLRRTRRRAPLLLLRWVSAVIDSWRTVLIPRLIALGRRLSPLLGGRCAVVVLLTVHGCLCCRCGCELRWGQERLFGGTKGVYKLVSAVEAVLGQIFARVQAIFPGEREDAELRIKRG